MDTQIKSQLNTEYHENGFCIIENALPQELIQKAREGLNSVRAGEYDTGLAPEPSPWNPGDDPNQLCKIELPNKSNQGIQELISHPALGKLASEITGADQVQVWWVQLLHKPSGKPHAKTSVGWHQDRHYWPMWSPESELFTAWIALSNVEENSGPVKFVKGSHRWGLLKQGNFFGQNNEKLKQEIQSPKGESWEEVSGIMKAGSVSFHDCLTYHGSEPNTSGQPRQSFAVHLCTGQSSTIHDGNHTLIKYLNNPVLNPVIFKKES